MRTFILFLGIFASISSHAQKLTKVESFTPVGEVARASQVHVKFSDFMFALGKTDQAAPVTSGCDNYGSGRWLNPKEWVFDFKQTLPPLVTCTYTFTKGLKSAAGIPVISESTYEFKLLPAQLERTVPYGSTSLADISRQTAQSGGIDPDQNFVLVFNHPVSKEEIEKRIQVFIEDRKDPIGVTVLPNSVLEKIRKEGREWIDRDKEKTVVVVKPKLDFPSTEFTLVTLKDTGSFATYYYRTRPAFAVEMNCNRDNAQAPCSPIQRVDLNFNSAVAVEDLKKIEAKGPHGTVAIDTASLKTTTHTERVWFKGPFKAGDTYKISMPSGIKDIRGRSLSNQKSFPLAVKFDSLPAVAKFPGTFGVLESANPVLPLSVRNIEKELKVSESTVSDLKAPENAVEILKWMARVQKQSQRSYNDEYHDQEVVKPNSKAIDYASIFGNYGADFKNKLESTKLPSTNEFNQAEVIGIPIAKKGLHIVELESKILGDRLFARSMPLYTSTAVLVTNMAVHFKWGQAGPSLAWVTELSSGKPVSGAQVTVQSCSGNTLASGKTGEDGTATFGTIGSRRKKSGKDVSDPFAACTYDNFGGVRLVVMAKKDDDFSFTLDTFNQGIERWRFNLPYSNGQSVVAHSVLARDLLKPGQLVQMKHYFREFHWQGFTVPQKKPSFLFIRNEGSNDQWSIPVKFDTQGIATSEWKVPESAHLGHYSLFLSFDKKLQTYGDNPAIAVGGFEVQEFRLPVMNVLFKAPDPITSNTEHPQISVQGTYLSGGPAAGLSVEFRFLREKTSAHSRYIGDYIYSLDEPVKTGVSDKKRYSYGEEYDESEGGEPDEGTAAKKEKETLLTSKLFNKINLDAGGSSYFDFPKEALNTDQDGDVKVSMTYSDPNGEIQTVLRSISVFSRDRYIGINKDVKSYFDDINNIKLDLRLAEVRGKAVANEPLTVTLFQSTDFTHRAKLVGGFYGYQTTTEVKKLGTFCEGKTSDAGTLLCTGSVPEPGTYYAEVSGKDAKGRPIVLVHEFTIYGRDGETAEYSESDRLTLAPSKTEYNAGEDAVVTVKSSFKESTALVTLERDGVMEHFVTKLSGDKPEIKLPIKMEYSPNLVLSVLAVRPRLDTPAPTGLLDLAKPAFKLGMVELKVGIKSHELPIQVRTDQTVYQIRSKVKVSIDTKPGAEVALAVIDQALLKLKPNDTLDLLSAMMVSQGHQVETSTLQMNLIGKRHFGKKATPFGGGGGKMMTRELLDSLVAWKPKLLANKDGKIETDFKLNDSISGFVVVAVGSQGLNFYGTGKAEIAATQDLQIISSVPLTLRENDELPLQFLLRNTTLKPMNVKAELKLGDKDQAPVEIEVPSQSTKEVSWTTKVPYGVSSLPILVTATAKEGAGDQLKIAASVVEVTPVRVREGYLSQLGTDTPAIPLSFPADALKDKGGYRVQLQARLSEIPESVIRYLNQYPFSCLEQQTSLAIGKNDLKAFQKVVDNFKGYRDPNWLLKYFPDMRYGSIDLTAYIAEIAAIQSELDPRFSLVGNSSMLNIVPALKKAMNGEILVSETWWPEWVAHNERIAAGVALSHYEPIPQAAYESLKSVRNKDSLNHSLAMMEILDYSEASLKQSLGDRDQYMSEILTHYQFENTHLVLKKESFHFFDALSGSPDSMEARTLIMLMKHGKGEDSQKLLRSLMEDLKVGYFDTTPGNAWGTLALRMFRKTYEKDKVEGQVDVKLANISKSVKISEKAPKAEAFVGIKEVTAEKPTLEQKYQGSGKPWSFTLVEAAIPLQKTLDHGYEIEKTITPVVQAKNGVNTRGDVYEVKLTIKAKSQQTWIAMVDPIPSGASILSTENKGGSIAFEERRLDSMRAFYAYVPEGTLTFSYKVRLNQTGSFEFPSTRIEAMYDPTEYGETPNKLMKVGL